MKPEIIVPPGSNAAIHPIMRPSDLTGWMRGLRPLPENCRTPAPEPICRCGAYRIAWEWTG